ncbi:hypothetical protein DS2_07838 [Catenovulum agarivorans DS-2]|uniref:Ig-like domain-containing protein n=1 Tax=Catenovulum agarivorans DS-2 TaxID=1328313 RepID=W7QRM7_9ALTE|nr:heparin lyase I family protein [Catenovulum agarivorans]EWH10528.1 hypothetical protein DS2_07838 [Catenovulum agarivorans DS-2]
MYKKKLICSALVLALSACGGGGDGASTQNNNQDKSPSDPKTEVPVTNIAGAIKLTGTVKQGQTLQAQLIDENGFNNSQVSYAWYADNQALAGQTDDKLLLSRNLVGKKISVKANYKDDDGFTENPQSDASIAVAVIDNSFGLLTLAGSEDDVNESAKLVVGNRIFAHINDANSIDGEVDYYWYLNDALVDGNNQASYTLVADDIGKSLHVKAVYIDADGYAENVISENTAAIVAKSDGIAGGVNYPVGASVVGNNPIVRNSAKTNEGFEGGGWNAGTLSTSTYTPGYDNTLTKNFRFIQLQGPHSFTAENTITRVGNYSAKLHWKHGDPGKWNGDANKIDNVDRKAMFHGKNVSSNIATAWYGFSVYFPSDGTILNASEDPLIFQLHGAPDTVDGKKEPGRNPPVALTISSGGFRIGYGWDDRKFATEVRGQGRDKFDVPLNFSEYQNRWVDIVLQIHSNPFEEKGFIKMWVDGVQLVERTDIKIGYNDDKGLYPSWGWYVTGSRAADREHDVIMYMDEIRHVEAADANYYDVAPGYFAKDASN